MSTKKQKPTKSQPKPEYIPLRWFATITNPKTGREVTLEVRKNGELVKGDRERYGVERVPAWVEIRAKNRTNGLARIAQGEGTNMSAAPAKKSRVRAAAKKDPAAPKKARARKAAKKEAK